MLEMWLIVRENFITSEGNTHKPSYIYTTESAALEQMQILAQKENCKFYLFKAVKCAKPVAPPVEFKDIEYK